MGQKQQSRESSNQQNQQQQQTPPQQPQPSQQPVARRRGRRRQQAVQEQPNGLDRVFVWDIDGSLMRSDIVAEAPLNSSVLASVTDTLSSLSKQLKQITLKFCEENLCLNELELSDQMHIDDHHPQPAPALVQANTAADQTQTMIGEVNNNHHHHHHSHQQQDATNDHTPHITTLEMTPSQYNQHHIDYHPYNSQVFHSNHSHHIEPQATGDSQQHEAGQAQNQLAHFDPGESIVAVATNHHHHHHAQQQQQDNGAEHTPHLTPLEITPTHYTQHHHQHHVDYHPYHQQMFHSNHRHHIEHHAANDSQHQQVAQTQYQLTSFDSGDPITAAPTNHHHHSQQQQDAATDHTPHLTPLEITPTHYNQHHHHHQHHIEYHPYHPQIFHANQCHHIEPQATSDPQQHQVAQTQNQLAHFDSCDSLTAVSANHHHHHNQAPQQHQDGTSDHAPHLTSLEMAPSHYNHHQHHIHYHPYHPQMFHSNHRHHIEPQATSEPQQHQVSQTPYQLAQFDPSESTTAMAADERQPQPLANVVCAEEKPHLIKYKHHITHQEHDNLSQHQAQYQANHFEQSQTTTPILAGKCQNQQPIDVGCGNQKAVSRTLINNHHKQVSQKLSDRFYRIRTVYNQYRGGIPTIQPKSCNSFTVADQPNKALSLIEILAEIDHFTLDWRKHSLDCLKLISESPNCTNIIITRLPLVIALGHLVCLGFSHFFDIDQVYSSSKTSKETCIKRIKKRFGATNRCSYIIVGDKEDVDMAKKLDLPYWNTSRSDGHRQLEQLYTALKEGYLM